MRNFPFNIFIGERRMIWKINGGIDDLKSGAVEADRNNIAEWRDKTPGAKEMFDYFQSSGIETIMEQDLEDFLRNKVDPAKQTSIDLYKGLLKSCDLRLDPVKSNRDKANQEIQLLLKILNEWNGILRESQKKRDEMVKQMEVPEPGTTDDVIYSQVSPIEWTKKGLGFTLGGFGKAFKNAKGSEKAIMLAGVGVTVLAIVHYVKKSPKLRKYLWNAALIGGGALTVDAIFRGVQHARGAYNSDEVQTKKILDETHEQLTTKGLNIPQELLNEVMEGDKKYGLALANLTTLKASELENLYNNGRGSSAINIDDPGYPQKMKTEKGYDINDGLTPSERFFLVKEVADALGLLDASGNFSYKDPSIAGQSILTLAVSWEYPNPGEQYLHRRGLQKDPSSGTWEYNATGFTEYFFKFDEASKQWSWRFEDAATWNSLAKKPVDYQEGDPNIGPNEVGYPISYGTGLRDFGLMEARKIIQDLEAL